MKHTLEKRLDLDFHLQKGSQYEFLFNLGQLTEKIRVYGIQSPEVEEWKTQMQDKYGIVRKQIKSYYFELQSYLHNTEVKK